MSEKAKKKKKSAEPNEPAPAVDEGLAALSALVRPSTMPPPNEDEADDGKLDLRALAASIPPPGASEDAGGEDDDDDDEHESDSGAAAAPPPEVEAKKTGPKKRKKAASSPAKAEPIAVATPAQPEKSGGNMWIGIGIGVAIAAGAVIFVMRNGHEGEPGSALASSAPTSVGAGAEPSGTPAADPVAAQVAPAQVAHAELDEAPVAAEQPTEPTGAEPTTDVGSEAPPVEEAPARAGAPRRARAGAPSRAEPAQPAQPAQPAVAAAPARTARPAPATGGTPPRSIDNMLDQALGGQPTREGTGTRPPPAAAQPQPAAAAPAASGDLPDTPSRADIQRTLGRYMAQIRQCAGDQVGMANATIIVRNDGTVASVAVGGSPFGGTPQGACMEGAIRSASFPRFRQSTFRVSFPFNIR